MPKMFDFFFFPKTCVVVFSRIEVFIIQTLVFNIFFFILKLIKLYQINQHDFIILQECLTYMQFNKSFVYSEFWFGTPTLPHMQYL